MPPALGGKWEVAVGGGATAPPALNLDFAPRANNQGEPKRLGLNWLPYYCVWPERGSLGPFLEASWVFSGWAGVMDARKRVSWSGAEPCGGLSESTQCCSAAKPQQSWSTCEHIIKAEWQSRTFWFLDLKPLPFWNWCFTISSWSDQVYCSLTSPCLSFVQFDLIKLINIHSILELLNRYCGQKVSLQSKPECFLPSLLTSTDCQFRWRVYGVTLLQLSHIG